MTLYHRTSLDKPIFNNIVIKKIGVVFVNSHFRGIPYNKDLVAQGLSSTETLFDDLGIEDRRVLADYSKKQIVEVFDSL